MDYKDLKPQAVFSFFHEISQIPRGSGNEKEISDYLVRFAEARELSVIQDEANNVVIKKKASLGYEDAKKVILQAHIDMVNEKEESSNHDFEKDPIKLLVDGDMLHADNTTLGADDGIGVAMILSILDSNIIKHGPLEAVFTVSEETNLGGALALSDKILEGEYLINIDSEKEGKMTVGSAGGILYTSKYPIDYKTFCFEHKAYEVKFSGFTGGHSGVEIAKNKGNMIKVMADFLSRLEDARLIDLTCGNKDNAIPRFGYIKVALKDYKNAVAVGEVLKETYKDIEGDLQIEFKEIDIDCKALTSYDTHKFANYLLDLPTGVDSFTDESKKYVSSSSNLAIIYKEDNYFIIFDSIRFNTEKEMDNFKHIFSEISKDYEVEFDFSNYYPQWEFKKDSILREKAGDLYKEMYGKDMLVDITHGGLECGVFYVKYNHLDMMSIGPDIFNPHTPQESLSISSTERVYTYVIKLLEILK